MASTFANAGAQWRVRQSGNELNGGGFDPFVTSAGTDYSDQDAPQLSSTTGTCTVGSTTWTDTGVTFTSAMVGNVIRISATTGGTAIALDYFVVTAFTDASNVVLDRSPCATTNITAATYRLGGAFASLKSFASAATGTLGTPVLGTPVIPGNRIYIRGAGTLDPSAADYDWSGGTWTVPNGTRSAAGAGPITLIGYNGRPRIDHQGGLLTGHWDVKHLSIFRKLNTTVAPFNTFSSGNVFTSAVDCIYDQNGFDSTEWYGQYGNALFCEFRNTGGGAAGTAHVCAVQHPSNAVMGCYFHGLRGPALSCRFSTATPTSLAAFCYNTIVNNLSDGILINGTGNTFGYSVYNNTINNNGGHGINVSSGQMSNFACFNNIISNHTGSGKFAINFVDSYQINRRLHKNVFDFNCFYGNTTKFNQVASVDTWQLQANDLTSDPQYENAGAGNYVTGANVRNKGLSGLGGLNGTLGTAVNQVNIGAYQGQAATFIPKSWVPALGPIFAQ